MRILLTCLALLSSGAAHAATVCVYDPGGKSGDYYRIMEGWALEAASWGTSVQLQPYTDEETATKDYEAGQCDGVLATGVRLQRFNRFPTTLEAVGALPSYELLEGMLKTLATSQGAASKLSSGGHVTAGFVPVGAAYLFVRDRKVDTVAELAGKRIATLDYDQASVTMVDRVGAIMVPADLGSLGPKFNNGDVDACYASAPAYQPFELWRGLEGGGGIVEAPLAQATLQVLLREDRFAAGFAEASRKELYKRWGEAKAVIDAAEASIPAKYWIEVPEDTFAAWEEMFQGVRVSLRDDVGAYDGEMLSVMRQLRCSSDPARAECAEKKE